MICQLILLTLNTPRQQTFRSFFLEQLITRSLSIFLLQLPLGLSAVANEFIPEMRGISDWVFVLLIFVPFFFISAAFSTASTWILIKDKTTLLAAAAKTLPHLGKLIPCALVVGLSVVLGLSLIFPAIYFSATYFFVPLLIVDGKGGKTLETLLLSRRMAKKRMGKLFSVALLLFLLDLGGLFLSSELGGGTRSHDWYSLLVSGLVAMLTGSVANLVVPFWYIQLTNEDHSRHA